MKFVPVKVKDAFPQIGLGLPEGSIFPQIQDFGNSGEARGEARGEAIGEAM